MESNVSPVVVENGTTQVRPFSTEWFISMKSPMQLWEENWFALVLEVAVAAIMFQVYRHAKRSDSYQTYLLLAAMTTTVSFEVLPVIPRAGYQLWWYHQGTVNILKQRVPSYVIFIYTLIYYLAHRVTSQCKLPSLTRSTLTAVLAMLMVFPCLYLSPRLLLLMLHFDDPIFTDQIAGVPYIQLVVLTLLFFHTSHLFDQNYSELQPHEHTTFNYVKCALQTGIVSAAYTIVEQYILYIVINLTMRMNTGVCLFMTLFVLAWLARNELKEMQMISYEVQSILTPLWRKEWWLVLAAMLFTSSLPLWLNTQNLKSTGDRLELGPCQSMHSVMNTSPLLVDRRRFVCPDDGYRLAFDFHCVSQKDLEYGVKNRTRNYTICGKSFQKPVQTTKNLAVYAVICQVFFHMAMMFSFSFKGKIHEECKKAL